MQRLSLLLAVLAVCFSCVHSESSSSANGSFSSSSAVISGVASSAGLIVFVVLVGLCACNGGAIKKTLAPLLSPQQLQQAKADNTLYVINVDSATPPMKPQVQIDADTMESTPIPLAPPPLSKKQLKQQAKAEAAAKAAAAAEETAKQLREQQEQAKAQAQAQDQQAQPLVVGQTQVAVEPQGEAVQQQPPPPPPQPQPLATKAQAPEVVILPPQNENVDDGETIVVVTEVRTESAPVTVVIEQPVPAEPMPTVTVAEPSTPERPNASMIQTEPIGALDFHWNSVGTKEVLVVTSQDGWQAKHPLTQRSNGTFEGSIVLPEGTWEYRYVVDGQWLHQDDAPKVSNGFGSFNNIITSPKKN